MQIIKVCHLTTAHEPFDDRIYHKQCKSLLKEGYDVAVIAQNDKDQMVNGIKVIALKKVKNRIHRMLGLTVQTLFKSLHQKADIYHFHDPELLPIGIILKLFSGNKIIYDVHEDYSKQILYKSHFPKIIRSSISLLIRMTEYLSSKLFDGIITATDDILRKFSYHKRAVSIKNYPILSYFTGIINKDNREHCKSKVFNLVYVGNISKERGIIEMIRALEYINQPIKLSLYGNYDSNSYESELCNLKGYEKVEFLGWIQHEKITELLSGYDSGIVCLHPIPNYITALPIKLFEYMAAGLPVVASNFPLLREIVEENKCGVCVDPLNPEEIAGAIEYFMDYPEERKKMGEIGRKTVLEKYNWEKENKKLSQLYREILRK